MSNSGEVLIDLDVPHKLSPPRVPSSAHGLTVLASLALSVGSPQRPCHLCQCILCNTQAIGNEFHCISGCTKLTHIRCRFPKLFLNWLYAYVHLAQGPDKCEALPDSLAASCPDMTAEWTLRARLAGCIDIEKLSLCVSFSLFPFVSSSPRTMQAQQSSTCCYWLVLEALDLRLHHCINTSPGGSHFLGIACQPQDLRSRAKAFPCRHVGSVVDTLPCSVNAGDDAAFVPVQMKK